MCGTELPEAKIVVNPRQAKEFLDMGFSRDMLTISPDIKSGHAPAERDNKFPSMRVAGYTIRHPEERFPRAGGKPSKGTPKDRRLKRNKRGKR